MQTAQSAAGSRSRSGRIKLVLTVITIGWLLVQTAAGLRETNEPYPVTGFSMFSHPTEGRLTEFELLGVDLDGEVVPVDHDAFGLTELQLRAFIVRSIGPSAADNRPHGTQRLQRMAEIHAERGGSELQGLTVIRVDHAIDRQQPERHRVSGWSR